MNKLFATTASRQSLWVAPASQRLTRILTPCLFLLAMACTTARTSRQTGQKIRLQVGDIKEISIATRPDTTWQLTATSDNQEVVDVSRKQTIATSGGSPASTPTGPAVFLIKGVTVGVARVVFSEKQLGATGEGRPKKTYSVIVTSK